MTSFVLSGNVVREVINGEIYYSAFCHVKGGVTFSKVKGRKHSLSDPNTELLLEQISTVGKRPGSDDPSPTSPISTDVLANNLIQLRFREGVRYTRSAIETICGLIYDFCSLEEELTNTRARESYEGLMRQVRTLLLSFRTRSDEIDKGEKRKLLYLITSIRYGILDVYGGVIPSQPPSLNRKAVLTWLKSIRKVTKQTKSH
jgi:hypothetical protein